MVEDVTGIGVSPFIITKIALVNPRAFWSQSGFALQDSPVCGAQTKTVANTVDGDGRRAMKYPAGPQILLGRIFRILFGGGLGA